jgi:Lrp/AsnC family leucine-responsive transcriptional regulator
MSIITMFLLDKRQFRAEIDSMSSRRPRALPATRLDRTARRLLLALSRDGRRPASALAKELGLSRQAVAERLRELERRGVIRGYHAVVDPAALGLDVRAQIRLTLDGAVARRRVAEVLRQLAASPLVRSVYRVSGEDCFVAQVVCRRIEDVNRLLLSLQETRAVQSSRTAFVLETLLDKGGLGPVEEALLVDGEGGGRERVRPRSARSR